MNTVPFFWIFIGLLVVFISSQIRDKLIQKSEDVKLSFNQRQKYNMLADSMIIIKTLGLFIAVVSSLFLLVLS